MTHSTENRNSKYYPLTSLLLGNLLIAVWIVLGSLSLALFYPYAAIPYIALAGFLVFYKLGKKGCVTCYYCKNCTIGMGKLPSLFFGNEKTPNVNAQALKLFPWAYLLLGVVPAVLVAFSLIQGVTLYKVGLLMAVLFFSVYSSAAKRQTLLKSSKH